MCSLRPDPRNPSRWKKSILCRTVDRVKEKKIHTAGAHTCINNDKNLSLFLPGLQNLGFENSTKNSFDLYECNVEICQ